MTRLRLKFYIMRFFISIFLLVLGIASYGVADESIGSISGNGLNDTSENSDFEEFDDFDDFEEFDDKKVIEIYDPLSGYNRVMTRVNDNIYIWAFKPLAKGYCFIVRKPVRLAIERVFTNGIYPVRFFNNLFQLKVKRAGIETARFCVNTTLGIAGLFDPAKGCMGLDAFPEDFGQTLGHYGVGSGFHIVLPVMGPSNLRDLSGFIPDTFLRPMTYVRDVRVTIAVTVVDHFNTLSLYMKEYDALRAEAIDLYVFQRDAYEMSRQKAIGE